MKTRIKELRARDNLTQVDLAQKVGVRRETIGFLEKGKYRLGCRVEVNEGRLPWLFVVIVLRSNSALPRPAALCPRTLPLSSCASAFSAR